MSTITDISRKSNTYIAPSLFILYYSFDGILCVSTSDNLIEDLIEEDGVGSWIE